MTGGQIHTCTIQKRNRSRKFTYTGGTGTPVIGQTVTGGTSLKTAVITHVGSGYIIVKTLSGAFAASETISSATFSGTLSAQADYQNQSGEYEYYWTNDQTSVACRFYYAGGGREGIIIHETGQTIDLPLKCMLPSTCIVDATEYRIVNGVSGFTGTYEITALYPRTGPEVIHHYEAVLRKVTT